MGLLSLFFPSLTSVVPLVVGLFLAYGAHSVVLDFATSSAHRKGVIAGKAAGQKAERAVCTSERDAAISVAKQAFASQAAEAARVVDEARTADAQVVRAAEKRVRELEAYTARMRRTACWTADYVKELNR